MDVFVYCIYDMHAYFLRYVHILNIGLHMSHLSLLMAIKRNTKVYTTVVIYILKQKFNLSIGFDCFQIGLFDFLCFFSWV